MGETSEVPFPSDLDIAQAATIAPLSDIAGNSEFQKKLQAEFDSRFPHPIELIAAPHEDSNFGIHRVTRFERIEK